MFGALVCTPSPISLLKPLLRYSAPNNDLSWLLPGRLPAPAPSPGATALCVPTAVCPRGGRVTRGWLPGVVSPQRPCQACSAIGVGGARQGGFPLLQRQRYNPTPRLLPGQWPGRRVPSSGPRAPLCPAGASSRGQEVACPVPSLARSSLGVRLPETHWTLSSA